MKASITMSFDTEVLRKFTEATQELGLVRSHVIQKFMEQWSVGKLTLGNKLGARPDLIVIDDIPNEEKK